MQTFRLCGHPVHRFGMLICYDIEFCEPARLLALHGATVLLVLTALADNGKLDLIPTCVVPTRALENHCWLIYSNHAGRRTPDDDNDAAILSFRGLSAIIGPDGQELVRAGSEALDCLLVADALPATYVLPFHSTPYLCDRQPAMYRSLVSQLHSFSFQQMSTEEHGKQMQMQNGQRQQDPLFAAIVDMDGSH
jgi:predicted amidohydrolase